MTITVKKFSADWCRPCEALKPIFTQLQIDYPEVIFEIIDIDEYPELAQTYNIRSVPTVIIEKDGTEINRIVGAKTKQDYHNAITQN